MYITGEAVCNKCGQVVKVDSEGFYSCDENHFAVKIGNCSDTYKTDKGRECCYKIRDRKYFYTQEDFTELNKECFEWINKIKEKGVEVRLYHTKSADGKKFVDAICSDMFGANKNGECTELEMAIYLNKRVYKKTTEDVIERLKKYYGMVKIIKNGEVGLTDRKKIEELDLFLDFDKTQKDLYDMKYYF